MSAVVCRQFMPISITEQLQPLLQQPIYTNCIVFIVLYMNIPYMDPKSDFHCSHRIQIEK